MAPSMSELVERLRSSSSDDAAREAALQALLSRLRMRGQRGHRQLVAAGLDPVVDCLRRTDDPGLCGPAADCLSYLCDTDSPQVVGAVVAAGAVPLLAELLSNQSAYPRRRAAAILRNLLVDAARGRQLAAILRRAFQPSCMQRARSTTPSFWRA
ncbi:hypothetical protein ABPG75_009695 [Micractinium tetrahymenae]